jgi:hypothetical protein
MSLHSPYKKIVGIKKLAIRKKYDHIETLKVWLYNM